MSKYTNLPIASNNAHAILSILQKQGLLVIGEKTAKYRPDFNVFIAIDSTRKKNPTTRVFVLADGNLKVRRLMEVVRVSSEETQSTGAIVHKLNAAVRTIDAVSISTNGRTSTGWEEVSKHLTAKNMVVVTHFFVKGAGVSGVCDSAGNGFPMWMDINPSAPTVK